MYAIVDLETTGGFAADNKIIEIAVVIHDGEKIVDRYSSLINPERQIPPYITGFTGISDEMVASAPLFKEVALEVYQLIKDKVFVAHNVNFDYSFMQQSFDEAGISYAAKRLCTVRLSRKIMPGFKSYSLGNLCNQLGIGLENAHRAAADCEATAVLFGRLLKKDPETISKSLKGNNGELNLPPNLEKKKFTSLPQSAGVYYFHDVNNKVIYVGKAKDIKKRVASHFSAKNSTEKKQSFLREIYDVSFEECGNELIALLKENQEIKRLWPRYNRAQKRIDLKFGIYAFEDGKGVVNLAIDKCRKYFRPIISFSTMWEARSYMNQLVRKYALQKAYCGLEKFDFINGLAVNGKQLTDQSEIEAYNERVGEALEDIQNNKESFALLGRGRTSKEHSLVMVNEGRYHGFGFVSKSQAVMSKEELADLIPQVQDHSDSYWIIRSYMQRESESRIIRF